MNTPIRRKNILLTLLFAVSLFCGIFSLNFINANASTPIIPNLHQPVSAMEYKALASPIDAFYWDNNIAVIQGEDKLLIVYNGEEYKSISLTDPKQVKKLGDSLIVSDNGKYLNISLTDLSATPTELKDNNDSTITGGFFDTNGNYLVSIYSTSVLVYKIENNTFTCVDSITSGVSGTSTVCCINAENQIFYIDTENNICKRYITAEGILSEKEILEPAINNNVSAMIANTENVYYVSGTAIHSVPVNGGTHVGLSFLACDYDLGKADKPASLSFKGNNLLIASSGFLSGNTSLGAVQEFAIESDKLVFTGFAVAKGLTAYNRISANAKDISQSGDTVAVLDDIKLTLITDNGQRTYSNYLFKDFDSFNPSIFALGENTALLSDGASYAMLDLDKGSLSEKKSLPLGVVSDVCYQSGYYYLLGIDTNNTSVYKMHETDTECSVAIEKGVPYRGGKMPIAVDVDGNVYLTDDNEPIAKYVKNGENYNAPETVVNSNSTGITELKTDLAGGVFALKGKTITHYYNGTAQEFTIDCALDLTCMSMNFDKNAVHFIMSGEETIHSTTLLPNVSIEDVQKTADYKISGETADISTFKIFNVNDGANVYSVSSTDNGFTYNQLIDGVDKEFVLICEVNVNDQIYSVLAGENEDTIVQVIINKKHLTEKQGTINNADASIVYITTDVSMYYLPIISMTDDYCLKTDSAVTRLPEKTSVSVINQISFLERDFYYVKADINEKEIYGYIPVKFTVKTLSEDALSINFTYKKLCATAIYSDVGLTAKIADLEEDTTVKLFFEENGVAFVAYQTADGWICGYVASENIKAVPNTAIRNVLIILAVTASVAVTSIYFIVRKQD